MDYLNSGGKQPGFFEAFITWILDFCDTIAEIIVSLPWVKILVFVAIAAVIFGACSLVFGLNLHDKDGPWFEDRYLTFSYGNINDKGYVDKEVKNALYTTDMIKCTGYRVNFLYGTDYVYEVHYFTEDDRWISGELVKKTGTHLVENGKMPFLVESDGTQVPAAGIRIVLVKTDKTDIGFFNKLSAADCLTLDIYKESEFESLTE